MPIFGINARDSITLFFRAAFFMTGLLYLEGNCLFGPELKLTVFVFFGFRQSFAAGYSSHLLEDTRTDFINGLGTVNHSASREVEVAGHALEDRRVRG